MFIDHLKYWYMISVGDTVIHTLSGLYYKCESKKHERWMNENKFYRWVPDGTVDSSYFYKTL